MNTFAFFYIVLNIFFYEKTALVIAAEKDNTEIVKLLLSHQGIDINAKCTDGKTFIMKSIELNQYESII